jgi:hypothetical protein
VRRASRHCFRGPIHHHSTRGFRDQLAKFNRHTDQRVAELYRRGVTIPAGRALIELPAAFLEAYVGRRHCMRGAHGYLTAMNSAMLRHLRIAKHYERHRDARKAFSG